MTELFIASQENVADFYENLRVNEAFMGIPEQ